MSLNINRRLILCGLLALGLCSQLAAAEGIPEPSLILYGRITNGATLISQGQIQASYSVAGESLSALLTAEITPFTGPAPSLAACNYKIKIPMETLMPGDAHSQGVLPLVSPGALCSRAIIITVGGNSKLFTQAVTLPSPQERGKAERVDFDLAAGQATPTPVIQETPTPTPSVSVEDLVTVLLGKGTPEASMDLNADDFIDAADLIRSASKSNSSKMAP